MTPLDFLHHKKKHASARGTDAKKVAIWSRERGTPDLKLYGTFLCVSRIWFKYEILVLCTSIL